LRSAALFFSALTLVAVLGSCGQASEPTAAASTAAPEKIDTVIHCGILIDGVADTPRKNQTVAIHAGRVAFVAPTSQGLSAPAMLDLPDFTCLPGLINTHVHFDGNPEDSVDYGVYARRTADETQKPRY
jgi:imidazolonepropionase-like amidohydrolase